MNRVAIVITTFNSENHVHRMMDSLVRSVYKDSYAIVADDGSKDDTVSIVNGYFNRSINGECLALEHGERGIARLKGIARAFEVGFDYLMILDDDMYLSEDLLSELTTYMDQTETVGGLVIKEEPFTSSRNIMSKVKVFERKVVNRYPVVDQHSIEAARFWRQSAYVLSGGINPNQLSFEEIQPTIRYLKMGGQIKKLANGVLYHDEKHVTLRNLLGKKRYHFMNIHSSIEEESEGLMNAIKRWYFFRAYLYYRKNVMEYLKHPLLALSMWGMYGILTTMAVYYMVKRMVAERVTKVLHPNHE